MLSNDFRKLWLGQAISALGNWMGALGLLAILQLHATPAQMGVLETLRSLPALLVALFAGVWVDRLRRRPILIWMDIGRAILLGCLVVAGMMGSLRIEYLYVVGFLVGSLTIFFETAWHAYLPTLVAPQELVRANSRLAASESSAEFVAPGLGGLLVQMIGAPMTLLIDAVTFVISAFSIGLIRTPEPGNQQISQDDSDTSENVWREISEGLLHVRRDASLRLLILAGATNSFFGGFFQTLYALFSLRVLGLNPASMGLLIGLGGLGSLVAAGVVEAVTRRIGLGWTLFLTAVMGGLLQLFTPLAALPGAPVILFLLLAQIVGDVFGTSHRILATTIRQQRTPTHLLGRVNASFGFVIGGLGTVGIFVGGLLGSAIGITATLSIAVMGFVLAALWLWPLRKLTEL